MSFYFAHNGIEHATEAEATAHSSSGLVILGVSMVVIVAAALIIARRASRTTEAEEGDED